SAQAVSRHGIAALADELGIPLATLRRWARVARRYPADCRRDGIPFSIYESAVSRDDSLEVVDLAAERHWSVAQMRVYRTDAQVGRGADAAKNGGIADVMDCIARLRAQLLGSDPVVAAGLMAKVAELVDVTRS